MRGPRRKSRQKSRALIFTQDRLKTDIDTRHTENQAHGKPPSLTPHPYTHPHPFRPPPSTQHHPTSSPNPASLPSPPPSRPPSRPPFPPDAPCPPDPRAPSRHGSPAQRTALIERISGKTLALAQSHYGHFFLLCVVRHGTAAHKQLLLKDLTGHVSSLVAHAEGSAVLQILYSSVATPSQRTKLYRELWGKDFALLPGLDEAKSLAELFAADPNSKPRVLRTLEKLMLKAARKGLAMTAIVQRALAELLAQADGPQKAILAASLLEAAPHIMHTADGAKIACACLRHSDPKGRKAMLKSLKGFVARAALNGNGALVLATALEVVDDTVMLRKLLLAELEPQLATLSLHSQGSLPLLAVLAPRAKRYFSEAALLTMGEEGGGLSKKEPATRRRELLGALLPPLCRMCAQHAARLGASPHGAAVFFETLEAARELSAEGEVPGVQLLPALETLAKAAIEEVPTEEEDTEEDGKEEEGEGKGEEDDDDEVVIVRKKRAKPEAAPQAAAAPAEVKGRLTGPLVLQAYGARLLKRLVKSQEVFAPLLLASLEPKLSEWAIGGGGWVVLALLEHADTKETVARMLKAQVGSIEKSEADGCRSLAAALKMGAPKPDAKGKAKRKSKS